ncbi:MAG: hypothetical protein PHY45_13710 [Rhodocyclaceae bacterium]|nr:hypothetical protein [Rhodocyclaceae bacterium]
MPVLSLIPAIIGSIIEGAADQATITTPVQSAGPVVGQLRTLPAASQLGEMASASIGVVQINGQMLPLAPGAQIRNEMNMIVMPTTIQKPVPVRYLVDAMGYVSRVWILTPAELAASR